MVLVIDPQIAGISGDMLLCSLVDLGADKNKIINGVKQSEKFFSNSSIKKIDFQKIQKHGIQAIQLILEVEEDVAERKGSEIKKAITDSVQDIGLSEKAKIFSESCIDTLISSESKIHGIPEDSVHLHEASSIDTFVDIVGITIALEDLELFDEKILCLPISVGGGNVTFSHGTMSNPASAILEIFKNSNLIIKGNSANEELTTPTGACILLNLTNNSVEYYPSMKIVSIGYGAGKKDFETFSNVLKIVRGSGNNFDIDSVKILETNVDDVSGEILGNLIEKIMEKGAKDISIYHGITKKGRPTNLVSIICSDENVEKIVDTLVLETGTLGIRISESNRFIVPRTIHTVSITLNGKSFQINYKKSFFKGKTDFKIEFDDLKNVSNTIDKSIKETESLLRKEIEKLEDS
ncbi:nickel pincer cofactor biosynthesis protein LarC [Marine Group I thaumarchaeote]|uniref:Nickel pincer cofactor biosynthesis protein LarC n=1 Tax=Marine Group I thaumarchaeote TaxID=2511932 RepID=A0A7K4MTA3_9ARCH|nr:MAG: nickel pincer cofactor biosynthesis protein LarC [Nitrosopumilus sp. YT1]NMI81774.1 nickel pincer cofactor biosynthesis protein LarC [Candidatus Nitrosopumilus sp. MTA1]NWJ19712.1 nickel pincer cofactor biosynthesis protein LarC [Marine Group I thaumarchaeote]NWJ56720.1 nickel pincer cofactor biosynthesis protein LarC [Marine Group I thaumarchaeote]NWJ83481.1 nickel pincer cofactor biosynthesis protein LarC [Marine Group I thaumarchaeote]